MNCELCGSEHLDSYECPVCEGDGLFLEEFVEGKWFGVLCRDCDGAGVIPFCYDCERVAI